MQTAAEIKKNTKAAKWDLDSLLEMDDDVIEKTNKDLYQLFKTLLEIYYNKENAHPLDKIKCEREISLLIAKGGDVRSVRELANNEIYTEIQKIKQTSNDINEIKKQKIKLKHLQDLVGEHFLRFDRNSFKKSPSSPSQSDAMQSDEKMLGLRSTQTKSIKLPKPRVLGFAPSGTIISSATPPPELTSGQAPAVKMDFFKKEKPPRRKATAGPSSHRHTSTVGSLSSSPKIESSSNGAPESKRTVMSIR